MKTLTNLMILSLGFGISALIWMKAIATYVKLTQPKLRDWRQQ